jgi:hypothetical protein
MSGVETTTYKIMHFDFRYTGKNYCPEDYYFLINSELLEAKSPEEVTVGDDVTIRILAFVFRYMSSFFGFSSCLADNTVCLICF